VYAFMKPTDGGLQGLMADYQHLQIGWLHIIHKAGSLFSRVMLLGDAGCSEWSDGAYAFKQWPGIQSKPQMTSGSPVWPHHWGITRSQCLELLGTLRTDPEWHCSKTMGDFVAAHIIPETCGTGLGYALLLNETSPKEVTLAVSHAWDASAEEVLEAVVRFTSDDDVVFMGALSLYQANDEHGPTVNEQLFEGSAFKHVMEHFGEQRKRQAQRFGCFWHCLGYLPSSRFLTQILVFLAVVLYSMPVIVWGCLPDAGSTRCATRKIRSVGANGTQANGTWFWHREYEETLNTPSKFPQHTFLMRAALPLAAFCLLTGVCSHVFLGRRHACTRLLMVPSHASRVYSRLFCVQEIFLARQLRVPVVFAATLAFAGSIHSRAAATSHTRDRDRLRNYLLSYAARGKQSYGHVDWVLRRVLWRHRLAAAFQMLNWMMVVALLQWADRRVSSGGDAFGDSWTALAGVGVGILVDSFAMCCAAREAWRGRKWGFACAQVYAFLLIGTSISTAAVLVVLGMGHSWMNLDGWALVSGILTQDCFGFTGGENSCSASMKFWSAMSQAMFVGGCVLTMLPLGTLLGVAHIRCCSTFGILVVTLAFATFVVVLAYYSDSWPPASDFQFPVTLYYLTRLLAWGIAPFFTLCAAIWRWGLGSVGWLTKKRHHGREADLGNKHNESEVEWPEKTNKQWKVTSI